MSIKAPAAKYNDLNIRTKNTIKLPLVIDGDYKKNLRSRENVNCGDENQLPAHVCLFITFIGKFNFDFRFTLR